MIEAALQARSSGGPLTLAICGAGARGFSYAKGTTKIGDRVKVVAVAEPRDGQRQRFADTFDVPADNVFSDWRELAAAPRLADAVVISLLDDLHAEAAIAFAARGYHILLEKPMAPNEEDCERIVEAAETAGISLAVSHVLRYTPYTLKLREILDAGTIGEIVSIDHLEPIGHMHFAHSFVRGNWRREDESSSLLLAKSCHDIDWLCAIVGRPVERVSSFGSLSYFRRENQPPTATDHCVTCPIEKSCAFSAPRHYRKGLSAPDSAEGYMARVMSGDFTEESVERALVDGPYGRCVWACDNDVVDHQVVQMEFEGGATVSFTQIALSETADRKTRIFGTKGQITGDGESIHTLDFLTGKTHTDIAKVEGHTAADGHAGGDIGLLRAFVDALLSGRPNALPTGARESLASHRVVFAAERARHTGTVVHLAPEKADVTA